MALLDYEAQICHGCGGFLPETTSDDNEGTYVADPPYCCFRCLAINREKAERRKQFQDDETGKFEARVVWPAHQRRRGGDARGGSVSQG